MTARPQAKSPLPRSPERDAKAAPTAEEIQRWQAENAEAASAWAAWVEKNGVPLGKYRQF